MRGAVYPNTKCCLLGLHTRCCSHKIATAVYPLLLLPYLCLLRNPASARARGAAARARMMERYSPPVIAATLVEHFRRIDALVPRVPGEEEMI